MRWIDDLPIRRKLTLVILTTCTVVLLLACAVIALYEAIDYRRTMVRDATILADVLGSNTQAAIAFEDADSAHKTLLALQAEPHVVAARVYRQNATPFADYARPGTEVPFPPVPLADGPTFAADHLGLFRPVLLDGKRIGTFYVRIDLNGLYERLWVFGGMAAAVVSGAFLLALALSAGFQRIISSPILALTELAQVVAERKDYTIRAAPQGANELGKLTASFNHMLSQIHDQNTALTESEVRARSILDSALSAVVLADAQGRITDWNSRAESLFGWSRGEISGKDVGQTLVPPALRGRDPGGCSFTRETANGQRLAETRVLHRDGSEFPVEYSVSVLKSGQNLTYCSFITDITERKQAENRIQDQMVRLDLLNRLTRAIGERQDLPSIFQVVIRSLEENLPIDFCCLCLYEPTAHALTVTNTGMQCQILAAEMSMPVGALVPIDENGLSRCVRGKLVYEPDVSAVPFPFPQRLTAGGLRSLVAAPLLVESKVFGVLIIARRKPHAFGSPDCEFLRQLSEHIALAAHQAQLYTALQQAYDDLRQTQQTVMQQERLRALGQMASGIAHDINNAISPVALYTESLLESESGLSARARGYLETIKRSIEDVAHTVARMREFYRQREPQLTLVPVDLNQMVRQVMDLTRARWSDMPQQRGVVIASSTDLAAGLPQVMAVESEIREALINLVFNAIDALPEGGDLTVRTRLVDPPPGSDPALRRQVVIEVADSGIGMDEATRRRCLEPFFTTKGERGTGLGLAMVYGVMQRHGAEIEIESTVGTGTLVRLIFQPAKDALAAETALPDNLIPRRLRILLVDDDPLLLKSLRDTLEIDGHSIVTAHQGQAGIDSFQKAHSAKEPFSIVITDLGMPHVDGRKVASTIKGISAATPVILLTGWGQRLLADGDIPPHVDRVLSKPPKLRDLRVALAQLTATAG
jgi:PAS domain S-box-containing protein